MQTQTSNAHDVDETNDDTFGLCDGTAQALFREEQSIIQTLVDRIYSAGEFEPCVTVSDTVFETETDRRENLQKWVPARRISKLDYAEWVVNSEYHIDTTDCTIDEQIMVGSQMECHIDYCDPETKYDIAISGVVRSYKGERDVVDDPQVTISPSE